MSLVLSRSFVFPLGKTTPAATTTTNVPLHNLMFHLSLSILRIWMWVIKQPVSGTPCKGFHDFSFWVAFEQTELEKGYFRWNPIRLLHVLTVPQIGNRSRPEYRARICLIPRYMSRYSTYYREFPCKGLAAILEV